MLTIVILSHQRGIRVMFPVSCNTFQNGLKALILSSMSYLSHCFGQLMTSYAMFGTPLQTIESQTSVLFMPCHDVTLLSTAHESGSQSHSEVLVLPDCCQFDVD